VSRNSGNKTSGKRIEAAERVRKALELRKAGATFAVIAVQCGYSNAQRAHEAVVAAIRALPREGAIEVRQLELERLDRLQLGMWERAIKGDAEAFSAVLRAMKRRAELIGLDAPTQHEHGGVGGGAIPILVIEPVPPANDDDDRDDAEDEDEIGDDPGADRPL
jgi:hypothetical protein